ncbi:MAG TPA: molybdenum cofactor guanylyltransferase [Gaiellaceae bacterium]
MLLVGGASLRFGSSKAHARIGDETLAERAWRTLGEACDERIAVGKGDEDLPFPVLPDGVDERAAIHGLVAGLRAATTDMCVVVPVDMPYLTADALRALAHACRDAAVPQTGPLPGAYRKRALPALESGELSIRRAIAALDVATVQLDAALLANVNTPDDVDV